MLKRLGSLHPAVAVLAYLVLTGRLTSDDKDLAMDLLESGLISDAESGQWLTMVAGANLSTPETAAAAMDYLKDFIPGGAS